MTTTDFDAIVKDKLSHQKGIVKKELAALPAQLLAGEQLLNLAVGNYSKRMGRGLIAITDRRVLFLEVSGWSGTRVNSEDFAYGAITSISSERGISGGTLIIRSAGGDAKIDTVRPVERVDEIAGYVRERLAAGPQSAAAAAPDHAAQLTQLAALRDAGILTPDEFDAKKAEILARM